MGCVLVVRRERYEDWSLPKGKLEPGESWEEGALREVLEETGLRCSVEGEVGRTRYTDAHGRDKQVRYFAMSAEGEAVASNEVSEVRWVPLAEAGSLLSYRLEIDLLARLVGPAA